MQECRNIDNNKRNVRKPRSLKSNKLSLRYQSLQIFSWTSYYVNLTCIHIFGNHRPFKHVSPQCLHRIITVQLIPLIKTGLGGGGWRGAGCRRSSFLLCYYVQGNVWYELLSFLSSLLYGTHDGHIFLYP